MSGDGKPVVGRLRLWRFFTMVVTPGLPQGPAAEAAGQRVANEGPLRTVDSINYKDELVADAEGRVTLPVLIPGATYRFIDLSTTRDPGGPQVRKEFRVKAGEMLELGDLRVERTQMLMVR